MTKGKFNSSIHCWRYTHDLSVQIQTYFPNQCGALQCIPRNMHTVFALLCFVVVIHWLISPYPSGLLDWQCGNLTIAPVPAKQPWWIWINTSCEFIMNDCMTTTKESTTKPQNRVHISWDILYNWIFPWALLQAPDHVLLTSEELSFLCYFAKKWCKHFSQCRLWQLRPSQSRSIVRNDIWVSIFTLRSSDFTFRSWQFSRPQHPDFQLL